MPGRGHGEGLTGNWLCRFRLLCGSRGSNSSIGADVSVGSENGERTYPNIIAAK